MPHSVPSLSVLTHQLDVFSILRVLSVAVWLAWLQLVCCVIAEVRAAVRNAGRPAQVPLAGGTQALVHRLVTAALLTFAATAALSPASPRRSVPRPPTRRSQPGPARLPQPARRRAVTRPARRRWPARRCWPARRSWRIRRSGRTPGTTRTPGPRRIRSAITRAVWGAGQRRYATRPLRLEKIYVVQPPAGRFHESLWEIAQKFLGDGRRYREIFELNSGLIQPDGPSSPAPA